MVGILEWGWVGLVFSISGAVVVSVISWCYRWKLDQLCACMMSDDGMEDIWGRNALLIHFPLLQPWRYGYVYLSVYH
jgi:hypothetical protein